MKRAVSDFIESLRTELFRILDFWIDNAIDKKNGGFYGSILTSGLVVKDANRGAILNGRILWAFSAAYNFTKNKRYLEVAEYAYNYFSEHFIDRKNGGVYWELDYKGNPVNTRKQAYALGFAIYGLAEYYRASGNDRSLVCAQELFWTIEKNFADKEHGGYIDALSIDWQPLPENEILSKNANGQKSMSTHLHILESYANLYKCWPNPLLGFSLEKLIETFRDKIIDGNTFHMQLFFDYDWNVKSDIVSFGHDIEGSWLLCEASELFDKAYLVKEVEELSVRMIDVAIKEGSDSDGSIFNKRESDNSLDSDKHWWAQAEALVGFVNAWQIKGEQKYLDQAEKVWDFIVGHIVDYEFGEWFWRTDEEGMPYTTDEKAGLWKCPYHNSRAVMEVIKRLGNY